MQRPIAILLVSTLVGLSWIAAARAAPKADWLYPAGMRRGESVTVTVGGTESWPVKVWCGSPHVRATADKQKGKLSITAAAEATPGVFWLRLYNEQGASAARPFFVGLLPEAADAEPNDAVDKPQRVKSSRCTINGRLQKTGDVDVYAVALKKGQTLVASLQANRTLASPMDGVLQVVSADGFVLAQNDDERGLDPQIAFTAPGDGDYLVRTFAFPATPNSSVRFAGGATYIYRLTLTTGPFVDHSLPLAAQAGSSPSFQLVGWNIPPNWSPFSRPDAQADDAEIIRLWHPESANWLDLPRVNCRTIVEQQSPPAVALPVCVTGRIDPAGDEDGIRFTASKGKKLRFRVESYALGYPLDPLLTLKNRQGKKLAENDDNARQRDAMLNFTAPADGEYELSLKDVHGHGGKRYAYRLTAEEVRPDFSVSVASDTFVVAKGAPLKVPVKINRLDGFRDAIEVRAAGLPAGVKCPAATSQAKGKSAASVQLEINVAAEAAHGAFRILATSQGQQKRTRIATAPALAGSAAVKDLWLTVKRPDAKPAKK